MERLCNLILIDVLVSCVIDCDWCNGYQTMDSDFHFHTCKLHAREHTNNQGAFLSKFWSDLWCSNILSVMEGINQGWGICFGVVSHLSWRNTHTIWELEDCGIFHRKARCHVGAVAGESAFACPWLIGEGSWGLWHRHDNQHGSITGKNNMQKLPQKYHSSITVIDLLIGNRHTSSTPKFYKGSRPTWAGVWRMLLCSTCMRFSLGETFCFSRTWLSRYLVPLGQNWSGLRDRTDTRGLFH